MATAAIFHRFGRIGHRNGDPGVKLRISAHEKRALWQRITPIRRPGTEAMERCIRCHGIFLVCRNGFTASMAQAIGLLRWTRGPCRLACVFSSDAHFTQCVRCVCSAQPHDVLQPSPRRANNEEHRGCESQRSWRVYTAQSGQPAEPQVCMLHRGC